ncbi:hypothetical protein [Serratia entomophila]|uniref:hypothetical protein n=1 Tax=Serratia entomophila TaxID=42906 RepID=UPI0021BB9A66|nr:hypothetical protein [Serratia entomophila]
MKTVLPMLIPEKGAAILTAQANVCERLVRQLRFFVIYTDIQTFVDPDRAIVGGAAKKRRYNPVMPIS